MYCSMKRILRILKNVIIVWGGEFMRTISIPMSDTDQLVYLFESQHALGTVIFLHGAGEYALKYERFAKALSESGYHVCLYDQIGHGNMAKELNYIHFSDQDGVLKIFDLLKNVIDVAAMIDKHLPVYLMGHSMGSFIARAYLNTYNTTFDGHLFTGTTLINSNRLALGLRLGKSIKHIKGPKHISALFTKTMQDKPYQSMKKRGLIQERFEWVTSDKSMQEKYRHDPLMHHPFTISTQLDILHMMRLAQRRCLLKESASHNLFYFMSGAMDALCEYGTGVKNLFKYYQKLGYTNLDYKIYPDVRHELLHDRTYKQVTKDIITILNKERKPKD